MGTDMCFVVTLYTHACTHLACLLMPSHAFVHVLCAQTGRGRKTRSEVLPSSGRKRRLLHLSSCAPGVGSWDLVLHLNLHLPMMLKRLTTVAGRYFPAPPKSPSLRRDGTSHFSRIRLIVEGWFLLLMKPTRQEDTLENGGPCPSGIPP